MTMQLKLLGVCMRKLLDLLAAAFVLIASIASTNALARLTPIEYELEYYDCARGIKSTCSKPALQLRLVPFYSPDVIGNVSDDSTDGSLSPINIAQVEHIKRLRGKCDNTNIQSCADLAVLLFNHNPTDNPEVLALLTNACDSGDSWACAVMSEHSLYITNSSGPKYTAFYNEKATQCENGNQAACATYARLNALLPNVNPHKSIWYSKLVTACDADIARACVNLSYMLSHDGVQTYLALDPKLDVLKRSNRRRANDYAKKACRLENPVGCWNIALSYDDGIGVRRDFYTATRYFAKACELNHFDACEELSHEPYWKTGDSIDELKPACANGDFNACLLIVESKHNAAMSSAEQKAQSELIRKYVDEVYQICLRGSPRACGNVAVHDRRNGNIDRAERLASIACDREQRHGCIVAGNVWKFHRTSKHHHKTANHYLQRACDLNSAGGCNNLGDSYRKGLGVEVDRNKAERFFTIACNANLALACNNLSTLIEMTKPEESETSKRKACSLDARYCNN